MSLLRHTLEEERHEHIPTEGDPYGVPTGVVPRPLGPGGVEYMPPPLGFLERQQAVVAASVARPREFDAAIQKAIDEHLLVERKARAWDALGRILIQAPEQITPEDVLRRMANLLGAPL